MRTVKISVLFLFLLASFTVVRAQESIHSISKKNNFNLKVVELKSNLKTKGFQVYKSGDLKMERNTEFPIMVELKEGSWYQFIVVGDPDAKKMEMKLGMEGVGDFITDKFRPQDTNEYWTQFSFICHHSGRYLLTFYQRGSNDNMLAHVSILQRNNNTGAGTMSFR